MNEDRPLPEDDPTGESQSERLARIERRLRRLRPRSVTFDARTIKSAAGRSGHEADVADPALDTVSPRKLADSLSSRPYRGWRAIAVSWTCGMVAGALLMFLATSGTSDRDLNPDPPVTSVNIADREPVGPATDDQGDMARDADSAIVSDGNTTDSNERLVSSPSDASVAFQSLELWDPVMSLEYRPLRAGNYPRIGRPVGRGVRGVRVRVPVNDVPHEARDNDTDRESAAIAHEERFPRRSAASSAIDREQLLRELLGNVED